MSQVALDLVNSVSSEGKLAIAACSVALLGTWLLSGRSNMAPGPTGLPIVGNYLQIPTESTWRYFKTLAEKYGPVVRLRIANQEILVLDRIEDVQELLVKRSSNYSSRQQLVYGTKYRSNNKRLFFLPYGNEMKKQRAAIIQMLNARVVGGYEELQERGSMKILDDLLDHPKPYYIVKWFTAETLVSLIYGRKISADGTELKRLLHILETFILDLHPARHLVDTFPFLDYLPDSLASWRNVAREAYKDDSEFYLRLLKDVKAAIDNGAGPECFAARLWENESKLGLDTTSLAFVAGSVFEAGTDNTAAAVLWFIEAILLYPEPLKKAQAELDAVLGADSDTPPGYQHLEQLPYCYAMVKEAFRWMPSAPVGGPRATLENDVYKGYHIPAGTVVFANIWSIHHNPEQFPSPFEFKPERFLPKKGEKIRAEGLNEDHYAFGFGRRTCPGQYLATKSVWIAIVRIVWAFNITAPKDASGKPILPDPDSVRPGLTAEPGDYDVVLTPRSERHVSAIKAARASAQV